MPFLDLGTFRVHYQAKGNDDASLTVFVHGLGDNLAIWYLIASSSEFRSQQLVTFDLRGHGKSDLPASGYGLASLASDLHAVVEHFAAGRKVTLVGNSLGSAIALHFALDHPNRIERLALVEPTLPPFGEVGGPFIDPDSDDWLERIPTDGRKALAKHPIVVGRVVAKYRTLLNRTSLRSDLISEPAFDGVRLSALQVPILLVHASRSDWGHCADWIRGTAPHVIAHRVDGSHFLLLEAHKQVALLISQFSNG